MRMLKRTVTVAVAAALGGGAAIGVAACGGEDRSGDVQFEGGTGTETTSTTGTTGTETTESGGSETTETSGN
jgi:hypothetical protein